MPLGLGKRSNEYSAGIEVAIDAPKAVWMALAVSLANQLAGDSPLDRRILPIEKLLEEWRALHENGIVPQKPRRRS